jgi:hypothetical protein
MNIKGAVIEAVDRMPGAPPVGGASGPSQQSPHSPKAKSDGKGGSSAGPRAVRGRRVIERRSAPARDSAL